MKRVWVLCAAGISTHLFAEKMQQEFKGAGSDIEVSAHAVSEVQERGSDADLLLLTPQVEFQKSLIEALLPDATVGRIDFDDFAAMDAASAVAKIMTAFDE